MRLEALIWWFPFFDLLFSRLSLLDARIPILGWLSEQAEHRRPEELSTCQEPGPPRAKYGDMQVERNIEKRYILY